MNQTPINQLLTAEQVITLSAEIKQHQTALSAIHFGNNNKDIRTNLFNYNNPICSKLIDGSKFVICNGLIRNRCKSYLLYKDGKIVGEFNSLKKAKNIIL